VTLSSKIKTSYIFLITGEFLHQKIKDVKYEIPLERKKKEIKKERTIYHSIPDLFLLGPVFMVTLSSEWRFQSWERPGSAPCSWRDALEEKQVLAPWGLRFTSVSSIHAH